MLYLMLLFIFARNVAHTEHSSQGRVLQAESAPSPGPNRHSLHPKAPNKTTRSKTSPSAAPTPAPTPSPSVPTLPPTTSAFTPSLSAPEPSPPGNHKKKSSHRGVIMAGSIVGGASVVILIAVLYFYGCDKVATVKPWATGLSGQLQKAFVTGIASFVMEKIDLCKLKFLLINNCHAVVTVKPPLSI